MSGSSSNNRIDYIDRLRGVAVVAMFFVHSAGAWLAPAVKEGSYWIWAMRVSGLVAPVFLFLAGVSISLIALNSRNGKRDVKAIRRSIALRGLKIVCLGYGLHFVFWMLNDFSGSWVRILKVDILHCIGFSLAIFTLVAWPRSRFNLVALVMFVMIPIVGHVTFRLSLEAWLPTGVASYLTADAQLALFPFVPYAAWVALGLFVGPLFASALLSGSHSERNFWVGILVAAVLVYAAGRGLKIVYYHYGLHHLGGSEEPTRGLVYVFFEKTSYVLGIFFVSRVSSTLFSRSKLRPFQLFGKTSLFAYAVHLGIIYHLAGPYIARKLSPLNHVLAAGLLTVLMYFLVIAWRSWLPGLWPRAIKLVSAPKKQKKRA